MQRLLFGLWLFICCLSETLIPVSRSLINLYKCGLINIIIASSIPTLFILNFFLIVMRLIHRICLWWISLSSGWFPWRVSILCLSHYFPLRIIAEILCLRTEYKLSNLIISLWQLVHRLNAVNLYPWKLKILRNLSVFMPNRNLVFELFQFFLHSRVDISSLIIHNVIFCPVDRTDNKTFLRIFFFGFKLG